MATVATKGRLNRGQTHGREAVKQYTDSMNDKVSACKISDASLDVRQRKQIVEFRYPSDTGTSDAGRSYSSGRQELR